MQIALVTGEVVSTEKHAEFKGHKLLLVRPLGLDGQPRGAESIALDTVDAGIGDRVLVNKEGGSARLALDNQRIPVQALIVGVVDAFHIDG
ncbi:MAG: EutN/CcmL family microcompartment protein [bacterium]|jgi:ethanolamine utilization protein EutN|nr:EutN/CcmL family microcompartment protein [bacterium]